MRRARSPRSAGCRSDCRGRAWLGVIRAPCDTRCCSRSLPASAIANTDAPSRLYAAVTPSLPVAPGAPATELQAWITPPGYTRIAPIFLKTEGGSVSVPAGSHLTVNVSGGSTEPTLSLNDRAEPFTALDNNSFQAERDLTRGGLLTVKRAGGNLASWMLTVVADQPPTVAWGDNPGGRRRASRQGCLGRFPTTTA